MTVPPHSTKPVAEAHASEPRDDYDSDLPLPRLDLLLGYDHMDWPVTRLFGADDDPAAEARREERVRAVFADLDRQSEARAREFRERQAAERQREPPPSPPPDGLRTKAEAALRLDAAPVKPTRKPRKPPTLASVAKQASKAAIAVARYEVKPDGTVVIITGKPEPVEPDNPWPLDEFRTKETKQ